MIARCLISALTAILLLALHNPIRADRIELKNGGELRGQIQGKTKGMKQVTIETLSGAVVVVEREQIAKITRRSLTREHYETQARRTPDDPEAHWQLAAWCQQNRLRRQREFHLLRVVELDPNHQLAREALGHQLRDGAWMSRDEAMRADGYVKHGNRYVTPQEKALLEESEEIEEAERQWYVQIRKLHNWLTGDDRVRTAAALAELKTLDDPYAVSALVKIFSDDENRATRRLYVAVMTNIPGEASAVALARQALWDTDPEVRYEALNGISPDQYEDVVPVFLKALKHEDNPIVRRAGSALGQFGDEEIMPDLIDGLVTEHQYKLRVPAGGGMSFRTDGAFSMGGNGQNLALPADVEALLRTGQLSGGVIVHQPMAPPTRTKIVTISYQHRNAPVLTALQKLTGENFGYDESAWRVWLAKKNKGAL